MKNTISLTIAAFVVLSSVNGFAWEKGAEALMAKKAPKAEKSKKHDSVVSQEKSRISYSIHSRGFVGNYEVVALRERGLWGNGCLTQLLVDTNGNPVAVLNSSASAGPGIAMVQGASFVGGMYLFAEHMRPEQNKVNSDNNNNGNNGDGSGNSGNGAATINNNNSNVAEGGDGGLGGEAFALGGQGGVGGTATATGGNGGTATALGGAGGVATATSTATGGSATGGSMSVTGGNISGTSINNQAVSGHHNFNTSTKAPKLPKVKSVKPPKLPKVKSVKPPKAPKAPKQPKQ